jgi:hypothetical protein
MKTPNEAKQKVNMWLLRCNRASDGHEMLRVPGTCRPTDGICASRREF